MEYFVGLEDDEIGRTLDKTGSWFFWRRRNMRKEKKPMIRVSWKKSEKTERVKKGWLGVG